MTLKHRFLFFFLLCCAFLRAQNTIAYSEEQGSPAASLEDVQWIAGHWQGEALGGITEEIWTPALGGSMMCAFKLVVDGKVKFYELVSLSEEEGTLIIRLKHFGPALHGWEEKDEAEVFRLVKISPEKVWFDNFTFEKVNENEMNIYVVFEGKGEKKEVQFNYRRVHQ